MTILVFAGKLIFMSNFFLEQGVAPLVKFQASFVQPGVFTEYETPYKELLNGLQKYYNYQSNELIIFLND